jgi:hypothetical protein
MLTCNRGTWTPTPSSYAYEWRRTVGATTSVIAPYSATATYTVLQSDVGSSIVCSVKASNNGGTSAPATAAAISVPSAPANTVAPTVSSSGPLRVGTAVTCNKGTWTPSSPTPTFAYRWTRSGALIGGATATKYTTTSADKGKAIRCEVQATNFSGVSGWVGSSNAITVP